MNFIDFLQGLSGARGEEGTGGELWFGGFGGKEQEVKFVRPLSGRAGCEVVWTLPYCSVDPATPVTGYRWLW